MPNVQLTGNQSDFLKIVVAAAGRGDLETVRQLVDDNPAWIHTVGSHGRTMLWEAAYRGKLEVVQFLLERGADINVPGCYHIEHRLEITPYCAARHKGRDRVADYLRQHGATIDIHTAAYLGDYNTVRSHLDNDANLINSGYLQAVMLPAGKPHTFEHRKTAWATPLCYAVMGGNRAIVELLISRGATITPHSERLLDYAVSENRVEIAKLLLENGADPSKAPRILDDTSEMSVLLKAHGVPPKDINAQNHMGWPPLVYACRGDNGEHPDDIQRLLELGADIDVRNYKGKTGLHCAAKAGFLKVINLLIENGATLDATDNDGETPLFEAIRSTIKSGEKQRASIEALLVKGADPNAKNRKGLTPLQVAKRMRRTDASKIVELLKTPYTREKLTQDFTNLGIQKADTLFIHSSFKSLGSVEGGAGTVISALEAAVGQGGLILMPTFSLLPSREERVAAWNIDKTPSTVGWLTEFFRQMPDTHRSDHYSHAVAARGKEAKAFVSDHLQREGYQSPWDHHPWGKTYGTHSPMFRAYKANAKLLMIGVDYQTSTYIHLVEVIHWNKRLIGDLQAEYIGLKRPELGEFWERLGQLRQEKVGDSICRLFHIKPYVDTLLAEVERNPKPYVA